MAKPSKTKRKETTLRLSDELLARLEWAEYCRKDVSTRNAAISEALTQWLNRMEAIYGKPPALATEPKRKQA